MDLIKIENNVPMISPELSIRIADFKRDLKRMQEEEKELHKLLQKEMELHHIKSIQTDDITITYVAETYFESFDKEQFRLDNPDLYDEYIRIKPKKASVRVTPKEKKDGD